MGCPVLTLLGREPMISVVANKAQFGVCVALKTPNEPARNPPEIVRQAGGLYREDLGNVINQLEIRPLIAAADAEGEATRDRRVQSAAKHRYPRGCLSGRSVWSPVPGQAAIPRERLDKCGLSAEAVEVLRAPMMNTEFCEAPWFVPRYPEASNLKCRSWWPGTLMDASHPFSGWRAPGSPLKELERKV